MLNGVLEGKDTSLGLGLISNIGILLSHTDHHTLVAGTANNGREDSSGSVISGETSLAHAGAIVNNKSSNVFVTHLEYLVSVLGDENLRSSLRSPTFLLLLLTMAPGERHLRRNQ